jgi:hypothetical protein
MDIGFIVQLIVICAVIGLLLYAIGLIPGLPPPILQIVRIVVILIFCVWLLSAIGGWGGSIGCGDHHPMIH